MKNKECLIQSLHMKATSTNVPRLNFLSRGKTFRVGTEEIIRLEASSNYTWVYFIGHPPVMTAKVLRIYDKLLSTHGFLRTHRSHLVNLQHIDCVDETGAIRMLDASHAEISRRKKSEVYRTIKYA